MRLRLIISLLVFLLLDRHSSTAQNEHLRFQHLGTQDGLSHSNIICTMRDSKGFMWFGTRDGLNKYDGYAFTVYKSDPQNPTSLSNNTIMSIVEDKNGYLWIATWGGGLNRFDRNSETFQRFGHDPARTSSLGSNLLNTLFIDHNQTLWIGTEDAGLDYYEPLSGQFIHFTASANLPALQHASVKSVFEDSNCQLWIGTNEAGLLVYRRDTKNFIHFLHDDEDPYSLSSNSVKVIFADSKKQLWIGTRGAGLNKFDPASGRFTAYRKSRGSNSISHDYIVALNEDAKGNLWIGTENGGLSILNPQGNFTNFTQDDIDPASVSNNSIWTIYKDINQDMWIGTYSGDINFWSSSGNKFAHYRHTSSPSSLSHNKVLCMFEDSKKNIWVGTDGGGLNHYDPATGKFTHYLHRDNDPNTICGNFVLSIAEDGDGNIWIGTWGSGITVMNNRNKPFRHFKHDPRNPRSLGSNNAYGIFRDHNNTMWIATYYGGLNRYDRKSHSFHRYVNDPKNPATISSNKINSVFEDSRHQLWISTDGNGLDRLDVRTGRFYHHVHDPSKNSISNNNVSKIYEDASGNLWIGTMSGLNLLNTKTGVFTTFRTAQGLPNDAVFSIVAESDSSVWMSTNKGLSNLDVHHQTFTNYSISDGVQSDEFKLNAGCKTTDGTLYFGGNNGFNAFIPARLHRENYDPPLVITGFMIQNEPVSIKRDANDPSPLSKHITATESISLPYSRNVISFEFTALHYRPGQKKEYSYLLEGFDKTWNNIGTKRTATYTDLDPGQYTLRVRTRNGNGEWSSRTVQLRLVIVPPFWLTWWFRIAVIFFIVALIAYIYRRRINAIQLQKKKLQELVDQQTQQLKALNAQEHAGRLEAERLRSESEKARREADDANRAKSVFLATMSHEIRTPMNGVIGMASLLEGSELTAEQRVYAQTISNCGESLLKVINDILDFSKIEAGNMELESADFDLRQTIEEVLEVFAKKSAESGIELMYQLPSEIPSAITGDPHRLRQVLLNLVGNAIKFTQQGHVVIETELADVTADELLLRCNVRDTGIGIPADKLQRLFKSFTQVDSSTTRKYGGTGLGLVICEKLVHLMGGTISVSSEEGKGTCFTFSIRTKAASSAIPRDIQTATEHVHGKRILIVDDNLTNLIILKGQLEKLTAQCIPVSCGVSALAALTQHNDIDLVVADMQMPVMDGIELSQKIRSMRPFLPIILLTSVGDDLPPEQRGLFQSVLTKPVRQHQLYIHVLRALHQVDLRVADTAAEPSKLVADFAQKNPMRVMLAEDNQINQLLATTILSKLGYEPRIANNGLEAIDLMKEQPFDLIFMDMQMPEMDGIEATRYIRQHHGGRPIIIAMTANAMQEDREECMKAGMNDYLSKPIKPEDLMTMMEKWSAHN